VEDLGERCKQGQRVQFDLAWGPRLLMMLLPA
jgi:hypothetical protein